MDDMKQLIDTIGRDKLKKAVESDSPEAFKELVEEAGFELSEEQLEALAGGGAVTSDCTYYSIGGLPYDDEGIVIHFVSH